MAIIIKSHREIELMKEAGRILAITHEQNIETVGSGYFALEELPALSEDKTTLEQVKMCFDAYHAKHWETLVE